MLPIEFSTKVTQVALDLPSPFKETTLSLPQSLYRNGTMYMYRTTKRKLPALLHKNELGTSFWSLHSALF